MDWGPDDEKQLAMHEWMMRSFDDLQDLSESSESNGNAQYSIVIKNKF